MSESIEKLYEGTLLTFEFPFPDSELISISEDYSRARNELLIALGDNKGCLERLEEAQQRHMNYKCRKEFDKGFRVGGKIILEVLGKK